MNVQVADKELPVKLSQTLACNYSMLLLKGVACRNIRPSK